MKSGIYANVEAHYKDKGIDEIFLPPTKRESTDSFSADMEKCWRQWNLTKPCMTRLLEKALETIDALSPADVIIDTEWARAMVERL